MASLSARIDTGNGPADVAPAEGWQLAWIDQRRAIARLTDGQQSLTVLVEGAGTQWFVTIRGRRVRVSVQSWRERVLADAEAAGAEGGGPVEVRATLPGLVVAVRVEEGQKVAGGDSLLTIEAMKMQNEIRAPRDGVIGQVAVSVGQPVAAGVLLVRLD
ncbi:MAG TPA: acetyl-CoA carboxylase biotin carboxyl carrier protein subunit [Candidatus Limnocylindria bacterium]|nr:acetyl-CoA carboxylase biotin carboxyl carrier protein subunit [Candidatus Limnocylindria bacterium]